MVIADGELTALFFAEAARAVVHPPEAPHDTDRLRRSSALAIASWMRRKALRIIGHETHDAPLNASAMAGALREAGLSPSGPGFRL